MDERDAATREREFARRDVETRNAMRAELIALLMPSVGGSSQLAEYVVNNLTIHHPDVLSRAAIVFSAPQVARGSES